MKVPAIISSFLILRTETQLPDYFVIVTRGRFHLVKTYHVCNEAAPGEYTGLWKGSFDNARNHNFLPRQVIEHEEGEFDKKNMISSSSSDSHSLVMLVLAEYDGSTTLLRVRSNEEGSEYSWDNAEIKDHSTVYNIYESNQFSFSTGNTFKIRSFIGWRWLNFCYLL